ncbi:hypothetical protein Tco_0593992 [Tanacetum coccineum]
MAYTSNSSGSNTELGLESIEVQLVVHQKNEVVYEEKIAVLEFEVKDKGYGDQLNENDSSGSELFNSVFDNRSSDGDDNQTNDRFKKDNEYHTVPPPLTGNYMPPLADLSFVGLDYSVYRPTTNKTSASVSQVETSITPPSNTSVEMPRVEFVRPSGVIIEDWVNDDEDDIFQSEDSQKTNLGKTTVSAVKGNGVTTIKASAGCVWRPKMTDLNNVSKDNSGSWVSKRGNPQQALKNKGIFDSGCSRHMTGNKDFLIDYQELMSFGSFGGSDIVKNSVLFTETECLVLSPDFKLLDASQVLLRVPGQNENDTADDSAGESPVQKPASENEQALKNVLDKMMDQEKEATKQSDAVRKEFEAQCNRQNLSGKATKASSTNSFNTVSTPVNAASASRTYNDVGSSFVPLGGSFPDDPLMPDLEDTAEVQNTGIFGSAYDDEDLDTYNSPYADQVMGAEADFNNMEPSTVVSPIPSTRVHSIHPKDQIIGDPRSVVQTRGMTKKSSGEHAMISYIHKQRRTNHKDFQNCLFACFLSQQEPTKIAQALDDESWVETMQEELL